MSPGAETSSLRNAGSSQRRAGMAHIAEQGSPLAYGVVYGLYMPPTPAD